MDDIDGMKLQACMTLFALVSEDGSMFHQVLYNFYFSEMDKYTLKFFHKND